MSTSFSLLVSSISLFPALGGVAARLLPRKAAISVVIGCAASAFAAALLANGARLAVPSLAASPQLWPISDASWATLRFDATAGITALVIATVGFAALRFSRVYLEGDSKQTEFFSWMSLTLSAALTISLSGNFALLLAAWIATSLCLHRLLLHFPRRPQAVFAARKKFVISRLGDLCLVSAAALVFCHYETLQFDALFASVEVGHTAPLWSIGLLLTAAAALKSAQFPFHVWLPDTMETPTPVSAFMHAGIINAGGFLLLRLSPVLTHAPTALTVTAVIGAVTTAFGAIVMLCQPTVKRALAYSTIAQMGFMFLQCGLGAFALAHLHLCAHAFYKAYAFLRSGSTVGAPARAAVPLRWPALCGGIALATILFIAVKSAWSHWSTHAGAEQTILLLPLWLALAYGIARTWSGVGHMVSLVGTIAVAAGFALINLGLHSAANALLEYPSSYHPTTGAIVFVTGILLALAIFQGALWRANNTSIGRRFYVHALNGFYVGARADRLLSRLWPRPVFA